MAVRCFFFGPPEFSQLQNCHLPRDRGPGVYHRERRAEGPGNEARGERGDDGQVAWSDGGTLARSAVRWAPLPSTAARVRVDEPFRTDRKTGRDTTGRAWTDARADWLGRPLDASALGIHRRQVGCTVAVASKDLLEGGREAFDDGMPPSVVSFNHTLSLYQVR